MNATISACGEYRYRLERDTSDFGGQTAVIMVNPSTADAETDDQTIRKLRGFGERNGWGRVVVGNLFAYRATDVRELGKVPDPVGPENDNELAVIAMQVDRVVYAWGPVTKQPKWHRGRWKAVDAIFRRNGHFPLCIGAPAKCGHPCHPLTLGYDRPIIGWAQP
jgi:hypothetical protein